MYAIHTTPGFIIESRPRGEAGKLLSIFTRDLGLVLASAQGIRFEKSKLRYHAQEYSFGEFSFVRGREFWRLTSAHQSRPTDADTQREIIGRIALILRRLLHGEEAHPELFTEIESGIDFLGAHRMLSAEQMLTFESVLVFRMLKLLGYIGADKGIEGKFSSESFSEKLLDEASVLRKTINMHINKALKESHL